MTGLGIYEAKIRQIMASLCITLSFSKDKIKYEKGLNKNKVVYPWCLKHSSDQFKNLLSSTVR